MCGICGGWAPGGLSPPVLESALNTMVHRGPDSSGTFIEGPAFLGIRRLAVIDIEGGRQPIANEDGSVVVVFNGEIYNYRELCSELLRGGHRFRTKSDTEVLVHLYEEYGKDLCRHLRGMFAFAIYDLRRKCFLLGRDRLGKKPLYYARTKDGGFLFASELGCLQHLLRRTLNPVAHSQTAIYDYLSLGFIPQPNTIYENVSSLEPGSWLSFTQERLDLGAYWRVQLKPNRVVDYRECLRSTRSLVQDAVRLRLRSDVPVGIFLSGGVDSSVIAFEASRQNVSDILAFTVSMDSEPYDESPVARRTANNLGVRQIVVPLAINPVDGIERVVRQYGQPYGDSSAVPSMELARLARNYVTVALVGDGGDEVFVGYRRYLASLILSRLGRVPESFFRAASWIAARPRARGRSPFGYLARLARGLGLPDGERYLVWTADLLRECTKRKVWKGHSVRSTESFIEKLVGNNAIGLDWQLTADIKLNLLSDLLVKMDIASMASSLEARSPMLDHVLLEYVIQLPESLRLRSFRLKALLRDAYTGCGFDEALNAPKRGFEVPLETWIKGSLRPMVTDLLHSRNAAVRTFLDDSFVDSVIADSPNLDRPQASMVYMLLVLELWLRFSKLPTP